MEREELIFAGYCDIAGLVRGKAIAAADLDRRVAAGIGWTPTNILITAFRTIAEGPFGAFGDVLLMPDRNTRVRVDFADGTPPEHLVLCDLAETDGRPWDCCPRTLVKTALAELEDRFGLRLLAAFEHEFHYDGLTAAEGSSYSLDAVRRQGTLGASVTFALRQAGIPLDAFHAEYGPCQYEITCAPALGVVAADRAVILREIVRATAHRLGHRASFAPMVSADGLGNGVHVHLSLRDTEGRPATYDAAGPHGLSPAAGSFVAGILRHMPALAAFTAPSAVSYLRLIPHRWSASYNNLGVRDREAGVRIAPVAEGPGRDVAAQFNFEYRAADACASPHVALAAIVRAGIQGLDEALPTPAAADPETMSEAERVDHGLARLPGSLAEALAALEADPAAQGWFPPRFVDVYRRHKHCEAAVMADLDPEARCARYRAVY